MEEVDSPKHYLIEVRTPDGLSASIECIDVMVAIYGQKRVQEWAELCAFTYQFREPSKHESPDSCKRKKIWFTRYSMGDDPRLDGQRDRVDRPDE
jgi:hypothetical protein